MTDIKRKPRKRRLASTYATHDDARRNRRDFLKILGKGLLVLPAAGLANACGVGKERQYEVSGGLTAPHDVEGETRGPDTITEPDYELSGGAPFEPHPDVDETPDIVVPGDAGDVHNEPDWELAGDEPPPFQEIKEQDWGLDGIIDDPDLHQQPEDIQEDDYVLSGGIGEPPPE